MSLGKASCMLYTEAQLLLPKGSKICLNPLRFTVFRETKSDDRVMRCAQCCGSGQFHPWREKRLAIFPCDMSQTDCTNSTARLPHHVMQSDLLSSASYLTEAEPCAPHSSAS